MSRLAGSLVDGEGRRDSSGSRIFSGGNREEGRGWGGWGAGTGATGPAPQGVGLEKSQELTFSLRTDPIGMLKYDPQTWIFTHCKAGRAVINSRVKGTEKFWDVGGAESILLLITDFGSRSQTQENKAQPVIAGCGSGPGERLFSDEKCA